MTIEITVAYSPGPRLVDQTTLTLPVGASVELALDCSGLLARFPELKRHAPAIGIWGRKVALDHVLRDQDRLEVFRPLRVDPKVARRERFARQGSRSAGLFAQRRAGAKAGY